uniref:Uncharacterized protein n=1 Tax=Dinoroseobacter phage vB_DshS_R26L TaxID=3161158 RepID=A0AAU7VG18_9CAUD
MAIQARVIKFPHGDTFDPTLTYKQGSVAQDITNTTITSEVRQTDGTLVATLTVTKTAPLSGQFTVVGQTATWPENENLWWDVQFDNGGIIKSMPRVILNAESDVTQ